MKFEMQILNIFVLLYEETLFVGIIKNRPQRLITQCCCELRIDGKVHQVIEFSGERMIQKYPDSEENLCTIATIKGFHVQLTSEQAQTGMWKLVCIS
ncbi:hypothetical protein AwWohl_12220 [Gammaproteobacteria bacterium]|nr:hypothetical protein AwWohl_12220 [Gammaproteobacteria bacterium]